MPQNHQEIKIFAVDDHQIVLDGLKLLVDHTDGVRWVGQALNGQDALTQLKKITPDIILLDIEMPQLNGIETCKKIKTNDPEVKIIALTMLIEHSVIKDMLEAGAEGFLIKNASQDELLKAILLVNDGGTYYSHEVRQLIKHGANASDEKKLPSLSRRETEILKLIIEEKTTNIIAKELFISVGTVETHRKNIMRKLDAKNIVGVVRIALQNNLV